MRPRRSRAEKLGRWLVPLLGFLLPALTALYIFAAYGMAPFGGKSLLIMDMSGQYVEFLAGLKHVRSVSDLYFNWGKVLGSNYTGVFAYYSSSPLSWLTVFCPDKYMPAGLTFLTALKIGLCGTTMAIFLDRVRRRHTGDLPDGSGLRPELSRGIASRGLVVLFAALYALCSYNCVYSMCVMWLDGVIVLPLLLYFTEELVDRGRMAGLAAALAYIFIANYYVAFMCGVFTAIYFVYYCIDRQPSKAELTSGTKLRVWFYTQRVLKFAGCVLLAAALAAWLVLPTYFSLTEGKIGNDNSTYPSDWNYNLTQFVRKLFPGEYDNITNTGAPFFYAGAAAFLMLPAFFADRRTKLRSKLGAAAILGFMILSTVYTPLDNAWHIFQHPNWFPYRWTFVLCALGVLLAFRGALGAARLSPGYYPGAIAGMAALCIAARRMKENVPDGGNIRKLFVLTAALSVLFMAGALIVRSAPERQGRGELPAGAPPESAVRRVVRVCALCLVGVFTLTLCLNEGTEHWKKLLTGLDKAHTYETSAAYTEYRAEMNEVLARIERDRAEAGESGFAGVGQNFSRSYNEAIGLGYRSVAHYSSAFDRNIDRFMENLGYSAAYLWNLNFGATAATDSIFGIRYMLNGAGIAEWDKEYKIEVGSVTPPAEYRLLDNVSGAFDIAVYVNDFAVTAPFLIGGDPAELKWGYNCIDSQNNLLKSLSGIDKNAFSRLGSGQYSIKLSAGAYQDSGDSSVYRGHNGTVTYEMELPDGGVLYAYFGRNRNNESRLRVIRNGVPGEELTLYRGETNCIQRLGQYAPGEKAVFEFELSSGALYTQDNLFYVLDTQVLQEQTDAMKARALTITKFGSGYIRGTLPDAASGGGTMLIQVPYNAGWTVKADGVKVQTAALLEGLLTAEIPAGTKTVEIRFRAKGELPGLALSGAALVFCAASMLAAVIKKRRFSA
ncbi:MAG: YfhO family protein [Clostridia bacterium]|nr:YfhO family protein [Clostridia bacterium]